jgi:hypothetical protein
VRTPLRLLAAALAVALLVALGGTEGQRPPLRVLFLGNSLTAWNELPEMVAALGRARNVPIEFEAVTPGGNDLSDHWNHGPSLERLRSGRWDVVVLQQGPSTLPESQAHLKEWASRWAAEIRTNGATPALYGVWPENYRRSALSSSIASYRNAAVASSALLLPAGDAWRIAWRRNGKLKLYGSDGFHPSSVGTYLAALTVYAGLTRTSPVGLPGALSTPAVRVALSAKTARTLQLSAAEALRGR